MAIRGSSHRFGAPEVMHYSVEYMYNVMYYMYLTVKTKLQGKPVKLNTKEGGGWAYTFKMGLLLRDYSIYKFHIDQYSYYVLYNDTVTE